MPCPCICFSSFYSDPCCSGKKSTTSVQNSSYSSVLASELLLLLVSAPIRLPLIPRLLTQSKGRFVHPNLPLLNLHAWELPNNQSEIKNFRKTLQILSLDQEEHLHKKSMMLSGPSSLIGVIQKRLI